jgi:DNA invertase Pin-like site-specific DNA recombinase
MGKMIFTVLGSVAELERSLIIERVKCGLRNARAKGVRLGRPRKLILTSQVTGLRQKGLGWRAVGRKLHVSAATARKYLARGSCQSEREQATGK